MSSTATKTVSFPLPPLPYAEDALAPVISGKTISFHYGKHHKRYVDTMNDMLAKDGSNASSLEEVVRSSQGKLFNNAAQAWNHDFYWKSLTPQRKRPSATLAKRLDADFGSYDKFAEQFATAASGQFGSGWAWLVEEGGKLKIVTTSNADTPMARRIKCLLTVDVWEHAYYLDYQNLRDKYLTSVIGERLNWEFAEKNLFG